MTEYNLGRSGGDLSDLTARAQASSGAINELNEKTERYRTTEAAGAQTEAQAASLRTDLSASTDQLATALGRSTAGFAAETEAVAASNEALARNLELRRQLQGGAGGGLATSAGGAPYVAAATTEDPQARARLQTAYEAQAAAEQQQKVAAASYTAALRPGSTASAQDAALLLQQREELAAQVTAAKQETAAAKAGVAAQDARTAELEAARQQQAEINALQTQQRLAQERVIAETNAQAAAVADAAVSGRAPLALGPGRGGGGYSALALPPGEGGPLLLEQRTPVSAERAAYQYGAFGPRPVTGGPTDPTELTGTPYAEMAKANTAAVEGLGAAQLRTNSAFQAAGALYADSSNALSRHGALTTEFIQSLARGDVTLREFGSQMTSTLGKFGGWAIAGAAVYGVFDAFKHLTAGATETQAAVQQLGRFIPGLGGPAGGGTGQVLAAQQAVGDISTEFNVPIREVVDAMSVMARTFHTVTGAATATRAVLAVSRLDQVAPASAEQYFPAIYRSFGFQQPQQLIGVVNGLNELQSKFAARVSETLPAIARAAPAAVAAGADQSTVAALAALGVRGGLPGTQVGTFLLRSMSNFAFSPGSELTFANYGIHPQQGDYGGLIRQLFRVIDERSRAGTLQGTDITALGRALGGPLLGGRVGANLLVQEARDPGGAGRLGAFQRAVADYQNPRPYQQDLSAVLGTVSERFKSIGIALENFGNALAQAGALTPLTAALHVVTDVVSAFEMIAHAVAPVVGIFNELPGPLRDAIGLFVAFKAFRALLDTRFGTSAQALAGRLPGLDFLSDPANQRLAVQQQVARMRNVLLPDDVSAQMAANRDLRTAAGRADLAAQRQATFVAQGNEPLPGEGGATLATLPASDERAVQYQKELASLDADRVAAASAALKAEQAAGAAAERVAATKADIAVLADKQLSFATRAAYMEQQGMVATGDFVNIEEDMLTAARARVAAIQAGTDQTVAAGAAGAAGLAGAGAGEAGLAGAAGTAGFAAALAASRGAPPGGPGAVALDAEAASASLLSRIRQGGIGEATQIGMTGLTRAAGFLRGPGGPLALLLASQALPQGSLTTGIQSGASDALLASFIKPGNLSVGAGAFGLGLVTSPGSDLQHIGGGALVGGTIGKSAAASLLPKLLPKVFGAEAALDVADPVVGIPLTIATTLLGGFLGDVLGPSKPKPQTQADSWYAVNKQADALLGPALAGKLDPKSRANFQEGLDANLQEAYLNAGQGGQRGQQAVSGVVQRLTAELSLYGGQSEQGRFASQALSQVVRSAASLAQTNPAVSQQLIQTALQARSQEVTRQAQYQIAAGNVPPEAVARQAITATQATVRPITDAAASAQEDAATQEARLLQYQSNALNSTGRLKAAWEKKVDAQRGVAQQAQSEAQATGAIARIAQQSATLQEQQVASQAYQAAVQRAQSQTAVKVSAAGGNQAQALAIQQRAAQAALIRAVQFPGIPEAQRLQDYNAARVQMNQLQVQQAQQGLGELQARQGVTEARIPVGDPVAQAQQHLADLQAQYRYVQANREAFDPKDINALLAQVISAKQAVATTAADFATQMNDIRTQIAQARSTGDAVAQAAEGIAGAQHDLGLAVTPQQKAQATLGVATAQAAAHQAAQQRIQEQGQLSIALNQGDSVAAAGASVTLAQHMLASAHGVDEQLQAEAALANANYAYASAVEQRIQLQGAVAEAQAQGNPVEVARIAIATAQKELANAAGVDQQLQAEKDLADAQFAYAAALSNQDTEIAALKASTTTDPLQKLRDQIAGATKALADAKGPEQQRTAQTNLNNLKGQYETTLIDTKNSTIDFQLQMNRITTEQAISQLQGLLHMKGITQAERQHILEEIHQLEQGSGFDLAPGSIKMPTPYDVAHAMHHAAHQRPLGHPTVHAESHTQITVYVGSDADIHKVADAIDRTTGSHLRARMRSAGLRGG